VVALLSGSRQISEALTDELGQFDIVVPSVGTYSLRAMRVGFKSTTTAPFEVTAGETVEQRITASSVASRLTDVVVSSERGNAWWEGCERDLKWAGFGMRPR